MEYYHSLPESARERLHHKIDQGNHGVPLHLGKIADSMYEWEGGVAEALHLIPAQVAAIKEKHEHDLSLQTRAALQLWMEKKGQNATYHNLIQVFLNAGKSSYAEAVCNVLKEPPQADTTDTLQTTTVEPQQQLTVVPGTNTLQTTTVEPQQQLTVVPGTYTLQTTTVEPQQLTVVPGTSPGTHQTMSATVESQQLTSSTAVTFQTNQQVEPQQAATTQEKNYGKTEMAVLRKNEDNIRKLFADLLTQVRSSLVKLPVDMDDFRLFVAGLFPGILDHVSPSASVSDFFAYITNKKLWTFDHFDSVKSITSKYLSMSDNSQVEQLIINYKRKLAGFHATTSLVAYIALCEDRTAHPDDSLDLSYDKEYYQKLSLKLNVRVTNQTLEYTDELWRDIAEFFMLPSLSALLNSVVSGSLIIIWCVLHQTATVMKKKASGTEAEKFFRRKHIIEVKLNDEVIYYDAKECLLEACEEGDTEEAMELLQEIPDFDFSKYDYTPLGRASDSGHTSLVLRLLHTNGIEVDGRDELGDTALMVASIEGRTDVVELLLSNGADVNATNNYGQTALMYASWNGRTDVVKLLINHHADVNATDKWGMTTLMYASKKGRTDVVKLLINHHADVNATEENGWTALMYASEEGSTDVMKLLINHHADVNATDDIGKTALLYASQEGRTDVVKLLINHHADVNATDNDGMTALMYASLNGSTDVMKLLINHHADVNATDNNGWTALMYASEEGSTDVMKLLINHHADVNATDNDGYTALIWASLRNHLPVVEVLLEHQADVNARNKGGFTALMYASRGGHVAVVRKLLGGGADPNIAEEEKNWTAVFFICDNEWISKEDRVEIAHRLIDKGADVEFRDKSGVSANDVALTHGFQEISDLINQHSRSIQQTTINEETQKRVRTAGDYFRALLDFFLPEQAKKREGHHREGDSKRESEVIQTKSKSRFRSFFQIRGRRRNVPTVPTH